MHNTLVKKKKLKKKKSQKRDFTLDADANIPIQTELKSYMKNILV